MRYFLYQMTSTDPAPAGWGTVKDWFYYYKWARPEIVSFLRKEPFFADMEANDTLFFAMDGVVIAHATVEKVQEGYVGDQGNVQEIDVQGDAIWEHLGKSRIKLKGPWSRGRVPPAQGMRWAKTAFQHGRRAEPKV